VGSLCVVDMTKGLPKHCRAVPETRIRGHRKKAHTVASSHDPYFGNCTLCLRYNSMIHTEFLSENEMVVVEQPWLSVLASLPAALERKVYGT
jgi:hypothetical protein